MDHSALPMFERIARLLAALDLSGNANGIEEHAGSSVDIEWQTHVRDAIAILRAMREPDAAMAAAGDRPAWKAMIAAAINSAEDDPVSPQGCFSAEKPA